jgi:hypothetical protein
MSRLINCSSIQSISPHILNLVLLLLAISSCLVLLANSGIQVLRQVLHLLLEILLLLLLRLLLLLKLLLLDVLDSLKSRVLRLLRLESRSTLEGALSDEYVMTNFKKVTDFSIDSKVEALTASLVKWVLYN